MLFDSVLSPISWVLKSWGLIQSNINFFGDRWNAIASVCVANIWRGLPFFAISILAGLQAVPPELHEAAALDGANAFQRFRTVTLPTIRTIFYRHPLLDHLHVLRFPAHLCADQGRPGQAPPTSSAPTPIR